MRLNELQIKKLHELAQDTSPAVKKKIIIGNNTYQVWKTKNFTNIQLLKENTSSTLNTVKNLFVKSEKEPILGFLITGNINNNNGLKITKISENGKQVRGMSEKCQKWVMELLSIDPNINTTNPLNNNLPEVSTSHVSNAVEETLSKGEFQTLRASLHQISEIDFDNCTPTGEIMEMNQHKNELRKYKENFTLMQFGKKIDYEGINKKLLNELKSSKKKEHQVEYNCTVTFSKDTISITSGKKHLTFSIDPYTGKMTSPKVYEDYNAFSSSLIKPTREFFKYGDKKLIEKVTNYIVNDSTTERKKINALKIDINSNNNNNAEEYFVWYSDGNIVVESKSSIISKNQTQKLGIKTDQNGIVKSIKINNEEIVTIEKIEDFKRLVPAEWHLVLSNCLEQSLIAASQFEEKTHYWNSERMLGGTIVRTGIKKIPQIMLSLFTDKIIEMHNKKDKDPKINISFLEDDLSVSRGIDATGLSRDFITEITQAVCTFLKFEEVATSKLYFPNEKGPLDAQMKKVYENFGTLIHYCYNTKQEYVIGPILDDSLFYAIYSLPAALVDKEFSTLTEQEKVKVMLKIEEAQQNNKFYDFLKVYSKETWNKEDEKIVWKYLVIAAVDDEIEDENDKEEIKKKFIEIITQSESFLKLLRQVEPLVYMAKGAKKLANPGEIDSDEINFTWQTMNDLKPQEIKELVIPKIQGSIERNKFDSYFQIDESNVQLKRAKRLIVQWIKDSKTTDDEIRKMLQGLSGASGIISGRPYEFNVFHTSGEALFDTHTCFFYTNINTNLLSGISDKEFIEAFINTFVSGAFSYSNA